MLVGLWSWLPNATFKGTQEFMGKQVDVWAAEVREYNVCIDRETECDYVSLFLYIIGH